MQGAGNQYWPSGQPLDVLQEWRHYDRQSGSQVPGLIMLFISQFKKTCIKNLLFQSAHVRFFGVGFSAVVEAGAGSLKVVKSIDILVQNHYDIN